MRRLLVAVLFLALVGAAAFWLITRPQVIAASELPAYKPNLDNGRVMFFAGGCTSCHATPEQEDRTRLGGGDVRVAVGVEAALIDPRARIVGEVPRPRRDLAIAVVRMLPSALLTASASRQAGFRS